MIIGGGEVQLVLPQPHTAAGRVQLREVLGDLLPVAPDLVSALRVEGNDLVLRGCDEHDAVVDERRSLVALVDAGRKRPSRHQILDVGGIDLVEWAIALTVIGAAVEHPVAGLGVGEAVGGNRPVVGDLSRGCDCRPQTKHRRQSSPHPLSRSHWLPPSSNIGCVIAADNAPLVHVPCYEPVNELRSPGPATSRYVLKLVEQRARRPEYLITPGNPIGILTKFSTAAAVSWIPLSGRKIVANPECGPRDYPRKSGGSNMRLGSASGCSAFLSCAIGAEEEHSSLLVTRARANLFMAPASAGPPRGWCVCNRRQTVQTPQ